MPSTETIRRLVPTDVFALWHLRLEALGQDPEAFGPTPEEHRRTLPNPADDRLAIRSDNLAAAPAEVHTFVLGAFAGQQLVAIATFVREPGLKEHHKGHLRGVYVTASHRRDGLARRLLTTLIEIVRQDPTLEHLLLAVGVHREAPSRLYRSLGFTVYGTEPHALKVNGAHVDEHLMILTL